MPRLAAALLWGTLLVVGFGLAPPTREDLVPWLLDLVTGRWAGHPPPVVALFQLMGVWPALMALLLRGDWRARPPAWPFSLASFVLGCYALLPWFVLRREPRGPLRGGPLAHPLLPLLLAAVALALVGWAALAGEPGALVRAVLADGFVWAMAVDFVAFWLLSLAEVRARARAAPWPLVLVPLVGLALWLALEGRAARSQSDES